MQAHEGPIFYSRTSLSHIHHIIYLNDESSVSSCLHSSLSIHPQPLLKMSYYVHEAANKLMKPRSPRSHLFVSTTLHVSLISQFGIIVVFTLFEDGYIRALSVIQCKFHRVSNSSVSWILAINNSANIRDQLTTMYSRMCQK